MKFKEVERYCGLSALIEVLNIIHLEAYAKGCANALGVKSLCDLPEEQYLKLMDNMPKLPLDEMWLYSHYLCEEDVDNPVST